MTVYVRVAVEPHPAPGPVTLTSPDGAAKARQQARTDGPLVRSWCGHAHLNIASVAACRHIGLVARVTSDGHARTVRLLDRE